jgi:uncharacterized protein (DUF362 family)
MSRVAVVHRPGIGYDPRSVEAAVADLLRALGLDVEHSQGPEWNPLGDLVRPGDRVLVKPNLVSARCRQHALTAAELEATCTHGTLLRPVLAYARRAVGATGQVIVADAPLEGTALEDVTEPLGIGAVLAEFGIRLLDLRPFYLERHMLLDDARRWGRSFNLGILRRRSLPGDPNGTVVVDLGASSRFADPEIDPRSLRFHRSHREAPVAHHLDGRHEYAIPVTVLAADVIIILAKLKTHAKTGVTLSLKSGIGLVSEKHWLPHFTQNRDEHARRRSMLERLEDLSSRFPLPGGHALVAWAPPHGCPRRPIDGAGENNDTLWRTILDLHTILRLADRRGRLQATPQRRLLGLVDGIVAGEGEGPLEPDPLRAGLLVGGLDLPQVDRESTRVMGFDPDRIPHLRGHPDGERWLSGPRPNYRFRPPATWPSLLRP